MSFSTTTVGVMAFHIMGLSVTTFCIMLPSIVITIDIMTKIVTLNLLRIMTSNIMTVSKITPCIMTLGIIG
jgi:hypothetical protein